MNKQEFIISNLKPYFLDPSTCGTFNGLCVYLADNGNMCVFGKNMTPEALEEYKDNGAGATELLKENGESILKEESRGILTIEEWQGMQSIHDNIPNPNRNFKFRYDILLFTLKKFAELTKCDLSELFELSKKFDGGGN